jgi:DNA processing protein
MREYGPLLSQISDPPKQLFTAGDHTLISSALLDQTFDVPGYEPANIKFLCVIGSRKFTDYGKTICESLIKSLEGLPVIIVSGLALGIDSIAHRSAILHGLKTIAVPGSGLHPSVLYPRSHFNLANEIIEKGGLILSEYAPNTPASPWSFPIRNRIMAGLSHSILIIEAEEDSGTLITARLALEYNRDVGVIPGSVFSSTSKGPHGLLTKGAAPITSGDDLIKHLGFKKLENASSYQPSLFSQCSSDEKRILALLTEPRTRDELVKQSNMSVSHVQILLSMLEIRKLIKEEYGNIYLIHPFIQEK